MKPGAAVPTIQYESVKIPERNPGGGGPDTCYYDGSGFTHPGFVAITGGSWTVNTDNRWATDYVGYYPNAVQTYQQAQANNVIPEPCGTSFPQRMVVVISNRVEFEYANHTLGAGITQATVSSTKDGVTKTKNWP